MNERNYISKLIRRGCQVHVSSIDSEAQTLLRPCESIYLFYSFLRPWYSFLTKLQERIVYTHYLQFSVSGSHINSVKSGFYPHHRNETRLARVSVFQFAIFNKPFTSQDSQYCWLLFSSQKCLINILEDTPLLASLSLIILCFLLLVSFSSTCLTDSQSCLPLLFSSST